MALSIKHKFQSAKADSSDASALRPSNWNDTHSITSGAGQRLVGNAGDVVAQVQEIALGGGLSWESNKPTVTSVGVWTAQAITDEFALKADKSQINMTGDLEVQRSAAVPMYSFNHPGVRTWYWRISNAGTLELVDENAGVVILGISTGGRLTTHQLGWLYNRINSRAEAWANDRVASLNYRLTGQAYIGRGDIETSSGYAINAVESGLAYGEFFRLGCRAMQVYDPVRGWVQFHHE